MLTNNNSRCRYSLAMGIALLLAAFAPQARAAGKLLIGNQPMVETSANYNQYIKYLTVSPANQARDAFKSSDAAAIRALETPLRRQIFDAMNKNSVERFTFPTLKSAQDNFTMRIWALDFMNRIEKGAGAGGVDFNYTDAKTPAYADPFNWQKIGSSMYFRTKPGKRAADALDALARSKFRGECLGALEFTILFAARQTLGSERFNKLHPSGVSAGNGKSVFKHTKTAARINVDAMVPGDWVYMKNKDDYNKGLRPGVKLGYWTGENALYMGRYELGSKGTPVYRSNGSPRFSGMGVYHVTPRQFQEKLRTAYRALMQPPYTVGRHTITDADIRFTVLSRLVVS